MLGDYSIPSSIELHRSLSSERIWFRRMEASRSLYSSDRVPEARWAPRLPTQSLNLVKREETCEQILGLGSGCPSKSASSCLRAEMPCAERLDKGLSTDILNWMTSKVSYARCFQYRQPGLYYCDGSNCAWVTHLSSSALLVGRFDVLKVGRCPGRS